MSVKFNRAGPTRIGLASTAGNAARYSLASLPSFSISVYLDTSTAETTSEAQTIYSTGGAAAGAINLQYFGPNSSVPNTVGFVIGSASTIYKLPDGSIPFGWKGFIALQRASGGGLSLYAAPVQASVPADGSSVLVGTNLYSNSTGINGLTNKAFSLGARGTNDRGLSQTLARFGLIDSELTPYEIARLAYGETLFDLGKTPLTYLALDNKDVLTDLGTYNDTLIVVSGTLANGTAPPFGYVPSAPVTSEFLSNPVIVGTPVVGSPVSFTPGTLQGSPVPQVTQQWYVDGVAVQDATQATYTPVAGDTGKPLFVRTTATNTGGSDFADSAPAVVTAAATYSNSLTPMTSSQMYQVVAGKAAVPMAGTYNDLPVTIEARLLASSDGTTVIQDWSPLVDTVIGSNAWSGTLQANAALNGVRAQVRFKNASGGIQFTSAIDAASFGVGIILAGAGSSTIAGWFNSGTYSGGGYNRKYMTTSGKYLWEPFGSTSNGVAKKIAADLSTRANAAVGMIGAGESGTTFNEWLNTAGTQYGRLRSAMNAQGKKIGGLFISMGSNDVADLIIGTRATHAARLRQFIQTVRDHVSDPNLKVLISGFNRRVFTSGNLAEYSRQSDAVRMAERDVGGDANVYHFPTFDMVIEGGDGTHLVSYDLSGDRACYVFNPIVAGGATYRRGPAISAITYSGRKFVVAIEHRNGTDITPSTSITGFTAGDSSGALAIISASRVAANRIEVTTDRTVGDGAWLKYMSGNNPDVSAAVFDNGAMPLPMDVETDMVATFADSAPPDQGPSPTSIDATKVPDERRVVFEGSKRVVSFPGSIHKVRF